MGHRTVGAEPGPSRRQAWPRVALPQTRAPLGLAARTTTNRTAAGAPRPHGTPRPVAPSGTASVAVGTVGPAPSVGPFPVAVAGGATAAEPLLTRVVAATGPLLLAGPSVRAAPDGKTPLRSGAGASPDAPAGAAQQVPVDGASSSHCVSFLGGVQKKGVARRVGGAIHTRAARPAPLVRAAVRSKATSPGGTRVSTLPALSLHGGRGAGCSPAPRCRPFEGVTAIVDPLVGTDEAATRVARPSTGA